MNCIALNEILSTYVQYESTFNYENLFIMSNEKLGDFLEIKKKHEKLYGLNKENKKNYYREFNYTFKDYIDLSNIIFGEEYIIKKIEFYDIENDNLVVKDLSDFKKIEDKILVNVGLKVKELLIRLESKNNVLPKLEDVKLIS